MTGEGASAEADKGLNLIVGIGLFSAIVSWGLGYAVKIGARPEARPEARALAAPAPTMMPPPERPEWWIEEPPPYVGKIHEVPIYAGTIPEEEAWAGYGSQEAWEAAMAAKTAEHREARYKVETTEEEVLRQVEERHATAHKEIVRRLVDRGMPLETAEHQVEVAELRSKLLHEKGPVGAPDKYEGR